MPTKFTAETISDQKRLARGEHLLAARSYLRARDFTHNKRWSVLSMAGGSPGGEIGAIRELMPQAHITAVDRDSACLEAAIEAGCDEVVQCDLSEFSVERGPYGSTTRKVVPALQGAKFDLLNLDLCSLATPETRMIFNLYSAALGRASSVRMFTFSYGRDVAEAYASRASKAADWQHELLSRAGVPEQVAGRILYLFGGPHEQKDHGAGKMNDLRSVIAYRGAAMPMVSALFHRGRHLSFVKLGPGDFEIAVTCPDPERLYACPQERIEALRRSHAAIKAAYSRRTA